MKPGLTADLLLAFSVTPQKAKSELPCLSPINSVNQLFVKMFTEPESNRMPLRSACASRRQALGQDLADQSLAGGGAVQP